MPESSSALQELADRARQYCRLVEALDARSTDWLNDLYRLLPRVHAAAAALQLNAPAINATPPTDRGQDSDQRFELFSRLRQQLDNSVQYPSRGSSEVAEMRDSLADDIADIYFELRRGLDLLDSDPGRPQRAAALWRAGFLWHWGQHLVDAERHLYELEVSTRLFGFTPVGTRLH